MADGFLPPKQERSRAALARLLRATIHTLDARGLEGATIPAIAAAAGVAPAGIYRRFRDRDSLYRAALLATLESSAAATQQSLDVEAFEERSLEGVFSRVVTITMQPYHTHPGLMRALTRFIETDTDASFRTRALEVVRGNFERLTEVILAFRNEITHKDPRAAITFALLTMATLVEVHALEKVSMWHELLPLTDDQVHGEVTRTCVAYLQSSEAARARAHPRATHPRKR